MHQFFVKMGAVEVIGFTVLEWCGIAAIILFCLAGTLRLLRRLRGSSPRLVPPHRLDRAPDSPSLTGNEKILVADDDAVFREMMDRLLSGWGYHVVGVSDGEKAVEYMRNNGADLILLDALMGAGIDGEETCRRIRQFRPFQRVIMISGHASPERVAAIRNLGVEHYLIKPVPITTLAQSIRAELGRP